LSVTWPKQLEILDQALAASIEQQLEFYRAHRLQYVANGFNELGKLGRPKALGRLNIPDYSRKGVAVAYAFSYLSQRVTTLAAILGQHVAPDGYVKILDVGSGTDAAAVTWELLFPHSGGSIFTAEPAGEMARFGGRLHTNLMRQLGRDRVLIPRRIRATIEDMCAGRFPRDRGFDLVILSACFPYESEDLQTFAEILVNRVRPGATITCVEPRAKQHILRNLAGNLSRLILRAVPEKTTNSLELKAAGQTVLRQTTEVFNSVVDALVDSLLLETQGRDLVQRVKSEGVVSWNPRPEYNFACKVPSLGDHDWEPATER
jgi:hypothetical protein